MNKKQRIITIIGALLVMLSVLLCSCGNQNVFGLGNFTFRHIHFTDMVEGKCATVIQWYDNSEGIEVQTQEYGSLFLSEGSYILVEDGSRCPYCN